MRGTFIMKELDSGYFEMVNNPPLNLRFEVGASVK
jgi:hypothetical protein